ncbi:hypothetical protein [Streptomyces melanogenes]|uniref:hypothetical protein n=1 Tax=Streptomyces melanogenes TaxID=67326 RepID=UPI00378FD1D7
MTSSTTSPSGCTLRPYSHHTKGTRPMPIDMKQWRESTATADNAAKVFRSLLQMAGAPERTINSVRGAANHKGESLVYVGHLPADVVDRLAERLRQEVTQ